MNNSKTWDCVRRSMLVETEIFLICPAKRMEFLATVTESNRIECPVCKKTHLLPDGKIHTMQQYKELNMAEVSW